MRSPNSRFPTSRSFRPSARALSTAFPFSATRLFAGATFFAATSLMLASGNAFAQEALREETNATVERPHEDVVRDLTALADGEPASPLESVEAADAPLPTIPPLVDAADLFNGLQGADFSSEDATEVMESTEAAAKRVTVRAYDTPVKNQADRPWCTSFATIGVMENMAKRKYGRTIDLSEIHHWTQYQDYQMTTSARMAETRKIARESDWAYREGRPSGIDSKGVARITGSRELTKRSEVIAAIKAGKPVVMGTVITDSWQTTRNGSLSTKGAELGGHAFVVVGYANDARVEGGGYFVIRNSWGKSWGDEGYGYLPYAQCKSRLCTFISFDGVSVSR